jgi:hypothetical protein
MQATNYKKRETFLLFNIAKKSTKAMWISSFIGISGATSPLNWGEAPKIFLENLGW